MSSKKATFIPQASLWNESRKFYNIKSLMETMNVTAEKAMNALKIPQEEQNFYLAQLNN